MPMGKYVLVGRSEPISVFALLSESDKNPHNDQLRLWIERATIAIRAFEARDFAAAAAEFADLYESTGITGFQFLNEQADHKLHNQPLAEWSGEITLQSK